jgi:protein arginine kinase activator
MGPCERCKKAQATFHLTNIDTTGSPSERHLCDQCAIQEGYVQQQTPAFASEVLETFISGAKGKAAEIANLVCEECGMTYAEFRNRGQLGCPNDYEVFKDALVPLLERAHDPQRTHHVGKTCGAPETQRQSHDELRRVKRQLADAIAAEDYERAARLRDRIQELERE